MHDVVPSRSVGQGMGSGEEALSGWVSYGVGYERHFPHSASEGEAHSLDKFFGSVVN